MKKNDMQAFPVPGYNMPTGMTLRDYFAANVIQGICACGPSDEWTFQGLAAEAYSLADAMLEAREN
jgi:hypothetical protein